VQTDLGKKSCESCCFIPLFLGFQASKIGGAEFRWPIHNMTQNHPQTSNGEGIDRRQDEQGSSGLSDFRP